MFKIQWQILVQAFKLTMSILTTLDSCANK